MAEDKNGIIVYADWIDKFEDLSDEEAGQLIKHFFRYVNDLNPTAPDRIIKMAFHDIEKTLKRDLKKWEKSVEEKSKSGIIGNLKRWHLDLYQKFISHQITLEEALSIAESRKVSHTDEVRENKSQTIPNIAVNVNDNVNDTVIVEKIKTPTHDFFTIKQFEEIKWGDEFSLLCERALSKPLVEVKKLFTIFIFKQKGESKLFWKDEPDAKKHFINWLRKQPNPQSISASRRVDN